MFNSSLAPVPQFGPLFPKRAGGGGGGGFSPQKVNASSVYAESLHSAMGRDKFDELLREKLKLEGQLEVLQDEAQSTLQERAELQAQVGWVAGVSVCLYLSLSVISSVCLCQ